MGKPTKKRKRYTSSQTLLHFGITTMKAKDNSKGNGEPTLEKLKEISAREYTHHLRQEQSFLDRLQKNIKYLQMDIRRNVPGDGNCFFHCVCDQLKRLGLPPRSDRRLRSDLVNSLRSLDDDDPLNAFCTADYLGKMMKRGTWADAVAIQGMARMLKLDIHIVTSQKESTKQGYLLNKIRASKFETDLNSETCLLLGHVGEQHYISLEPLKDVEKSHDHHHGNEEGSVDNHPEVEEDVNMQDKENDFAKSHHHGNEEGSVENHPEVEEEVNSQDDERHTHEQMMDQSATSHHDSQDKNDSNSLFAFGFTRKRRHEEGQLDTPVPIINPTGTDPSNQDHRPSESHSDEHCDAQHMDEPFQEQAQVAQEKDRYPNADNCIGDCCAIRDEPYQPNDPDILVTATRRQIGHKNEFRSFKQDWYQSFPWLSVCLSRGKAYCHICRSCTHMGLTMLGKNAETAFTVDGFNNWKKAVSRFQNHMYSEAHMSCVEQQGSLKQKSVKAYLDQRIDSLQKEHYDMLLLQLSSVRMLLRQGLAIRGHVDVEGNLTQLLMLRSEDVPALKDWVGNKKYISPEIVNEQVDMMGQAILRNILLRIHAARWYSILADETRDISNIEQVTVCIRWVDPQYVVNEDFIGVLQVPNITAATLTAGIKDVLIRCTLPLSLCRGQGYDGAANMSGHISGVATRILKEEPAALHVHCLAHCLNLCLQDAARKFQPIRNALDLCTEVAKLILWSPKRMQIFHNSQREFSPESTNIRPLCPTRWTVRHGAIESVLKNYEALQHCLTSINEECHDDYGRRAGGVVALLDKFDTFFGLELSQLVFGATEQLSHTLQGENTSIMEAVRATELAQNHLQRLRTEEMFDIFYEKTTTKAATHTDEPTLPRYRRAPKRLDGGSLPYRYDSPKSHYRHLYFEILELVHGEINGRFHQKSMEVPQAIEKMLLDACNVSDEETPACTIPDVVEKLYAKDLNPKKLLRQMQMLPDLMKAAKTLNSSQQHLKKVTRVRTVAEMLSVVPMASTMFSEVDKLVRIFLTIPVTTASGERSFSTLRRIKTYLRSTMTQTRLNNAMLVNVHKEEADKLVIKDIATLFIKNNERRQRFFGMPTE